MKYTTQSSKYIFKNFLYIFPFAILPAFLLSLATDQEAISCAMNTFFTGTLNEMHFAHLFRAVSILNFGSWKAVVFGLLGIIASVFSVSMMMALLDKHMRIGKRTYNGLLGKLNDNLISTCGYVFLVFALYEIWALLLAALVFFFAKIANTIVAVVFVSIVYVAMHIVLIYLIGLIYLWLPCMQITGFHSIEALQYSQQLISPVKWKILFGQIVFLLCTEALICACSVFVTVGSAFTIITSVLYGILIMLYFVRMMIAYFDRDNLDRADLKKYYQY